MSVPIRFAEDLNISSVTVSVFGLGKMGLPLAALLADSGATVLGVDIDEDIVAAVNSGECPIDGEPGVPELVASHGGTELEATTDGPEAAELADFHVVIVPTLLDDENQPDLDLVLAAAKDIQMGVSSGDLVILESTVPPGTTGGVFREAVEPPDLKGGIDFGIAHCPERTSSGRVLRDLTESYPKIVGGIDHISTTVAASLYREFNDPGVIEMESAKAAEAVKVFEGLYRDVNIALANELAKACEDWGLDARAVFEAANSQPFCNIHDPGCGVGGHCIPVYPYFVIGKAEETNLLETARRINDEMPSHTVNTVIELLGERNVQVEEASVLVLGLTYRPGVRELRYAPGIDIVSGLSDNGATVYAHDPLLDDQTVESIGAAAANPGEIKGLDAIVLATGHDVYHSIDFEALTTRMRTSLLIDGRGFFDPEDAVGFDYASIGDGTRP